MCTHYSRILVILFIVELGIPNYLNDYGNITRLIGFRSISTIDLFSGWNGEYGMNMGMSHGNGGRAAQSHSTVGLVEDRNWNTTRRWRALAAAARLWARARQHL